MSSKSKIYTYLFTPLDYLSEIAEFRTTLRQNQRTGRKGIKSLTKSFEAYKSNLKAIQKLICKKFTPPSYVPSKKITVITKNILDYHSKGLFLYLNNKHLLL